MNRNKILLLRSISVFLAMLSIIPSMLINISTAWFMYEGRLPEMTTITLSTTNAFWVSLVSLLAILINLSLFVTYTEPNDKVDA